MSALSSSPTDASSTRCHPRRPTGCSTTSSSSERKAMMRTTLKNLSARKLRLLTTSIAVLLGVAFMAGTLVLTDTIGKTFDDLFANVNAGTDVYVRGETAFTSELGDQRARLDAPLGTTINK